MENYLCPKKKQKNTNEQVDKNLSTPENTNDKTSFLVDKDLSQPNNILSDNLDENSFEVYENLSKPKGIWESTIFKKGIRSETSSGGKPFTEFTHPIIEGFYKAYNYHCPITISPDTLWLLIVQAFSRYVYQNSEKLRDRFINFEGKKELEVKVLALDFNSLSDKEWELFLNDIVKQITEYTGEELISSLKFDFSTSTKLLQRVGCMCIMSSMQKYFDPLMMSVMCGFPYIKLEGTLNDWEKLLDKTKYIEKLIPELKNWISSLSEILNKIKETKKHLEKNEKQLIDKEFWKNIIRNEMEVETLYKGCEVDKKVNVEYIKGWIFSFVPYDKDGEFSYSKKYKVDKFFEYLATEIIDFPIKVIKSDFQEEYLKVNVGFLGMIQNETNYMVKPEIGYYVEEISKEEYANRDKQNNNFMFFI